MFLEIEDIGYNPPRKFMINIYEIKYISENTEYDGKTKIVMRTGTLHYNLKESFDEIKKRLMNVEKYSKITPTNRFELMDLEQ